MARLEELTVGASVMGIAGNAPVSVVAVKWHGNAVLEITFKDAHGQLASQLLYERAPIDGNQYHGNLLRKDSLLDKRSPSMRVQIKLTL